MNLSHLNKSTIFFLAMAYYFISCQPILTKIVGINNVHNYSTDELVHLAHKYSIDTPVSCLDTNYMYFAKQFKDSLTIKNLTQPLQIIFFNQNNLVSHLINCNVGGFPNLQWNRYGTFDSLPHVNQPILEKDLSVDSLAQYINPKPNFDTPRNICLVFWSNFMGRQSKNLIAYSKEKSVQNNYKVYYVNNDNFFYYWGVERKKK